MPTSVSRQTSAPGHVGVDVQTGAFVPGRRHEPQQPWCTPGTGMRVSVILRRMEYPCTGSARARVCDGE